MAEALNLNRARKSRVRVEAKAKAGANRVRFGRTKTQKAGDSAAREKTKRDLDGAKRER